MWVKKHAENINKIKLFFLPKRLVEEFFGSPTT
jgi:hypothetical protein